MNIFEFLGLFGLAGGDPPATPPAGDPPAAPLGGEPPISPSPPDPGNLPVMPQWASRLPEELSNNETTRNILNQHPDSDQKIEVPVGLIKAYVDTKQKIGTMVSIPPENAAQDVISAFNKKLGVPDKPDDYEIKLPEGSPEGLYSDDRISAFRKDAHELGIPKKKAEQLFSRHVQRDIESYNAMAADYSKSLQERIDLLKKDLGTNFDATVQMADKAAAFAGGQELLQRLDKAGLIGDPIIVKAFGKIGAAMGEDILRSAETPAPTTRKTKQELEAMMNDPKYKLPQGDPTGDAWRAQVEAGFKALYPGTITDALNPSGGGPV